MLKTLKTLAGKARGKANQAIQRRRDAQFQRDLTSFFEKGAPHQRQYAIDTWAERQDRAALPRIQRALSDVHEGVRSQAIQALGKYNDPALIPLIVNAGRFEFHGRAPSRYDKPHYIIEGQHAAMHALGSIHHEDALEALKTLVTHEQADVSTFAVNVLARHPNLASKVDGLTTVAIHHAEPAERLKALAALKNHANPEGKAWVKLMLKSQDAKARYEAFLTLGDPHSRKSLESMARLCAHAGKAYPYRDMRQRVLTEDSPAAIPAILTLIRLRSPAALADVQTPLMRIGRLQHQLAQDAKFRDDLLVTRAGHVFSAFARKPNGQLDAPDNVLAHVLPRALDYAFNDKRANPRAIKLHTRQLAEHVRANRAK